MGRFAWLEGRPGHEGRCCCFACVVGNPTHVANVPVEQPSRAFVQRITRHGAFLREVKGLEEPVSATCRRVRLSCDHAVNATTIEDGTPLKRYYLCGCCFAEVPVEG